MARLASASTNSGGGTRSSAAIKNKSPASVLDQPSLLPADHPHVPRESPHRNTRGADQRSLSRQPMVIYDEEEKRPALHKKTKSSVSLKSLLTGDKDKTKTLKSKASEREKDKSPKKSKSSTSLSAIFSRPKSSKGSDAPEEDGNKENQIPPAKGDTAPTPIWAQYATSIPMQNLEGAKVPLNDNTRVQTEISLYKSENCSPSEQGNFRGPSRPTLVRKGELASRPKSDCLPSSGSTNKIMGTLSRLRKHSDELSREQDSTNPSSTSDHDRRSSLEKALSFVRRPSQDERRNRGVGHPSATHSSKRSSRVMAAVAALQGKEKENKAMVEAHKFAEAPPVDPYSIDQALEKLLEARNIPSGVRERMRACDVQVKASFVRSESTNLAQDPVENAPPDRMDAAYRKLTANSIIAPQGQPPRGRSQTKTEVELPQNSKKSRSRSRTFTFNKTGSPTKKQKADRPQGHSRTKSADTIISTQGTSSLLLTLGKAPSMLRPSEFVSYLREEQRPQFLEVGKIHKLRQVLRNESVAWVAEFIDIGGMQETLNLLYRIVAVEWREEHEDSLLHETLLCLKALFTTSAALKQLEEVQKRLYPTLLNMLFDEERKGPSDFSTRNIIISLLLTYLTSSPQLSLPSRARTLLSYLHDPSKPEEKRPPTFIATIYHSRPFRVWNNEIANVTKEVFWIFMHHLNIMPVPPRDENPGTSFVKMHFPRERPPVAAAPYIGGVEWEATSYLATHLDLLNAIIASLPSMEERNELRKELRDSGFERNMGGHLRVCKEKFYGHVHAGLITWIGAADEDGWPYEDVRQGPPRDERKSPRKTPSPKKKQVDKAPVLDMPKLDLGVRIGRSDDAWL